MSRIYENKPLQNLPVISVNAANKFEVNNYCSGDGVLMEACIKGRSRFSLTDSTHSKHRYFVFHVDILRAHKRKFESSGKEIEPNFSETHKVRTGYLNSSYKVEAKGQTDKLSNQQVKDMLCHRDLTDITSPRLPEGCSSCISLWLQETEAEKIELDVGDIVRVKTRGNSPFIQSITRVESDATTKANFAGGENVGGSWTDKIMGMKSSVEDTSQTEGADDDEWDD